MSDIVVRVQIMRNNQIVDEFVCNPLQRTFIWETIPGCNIAIMPERAQLARIKMEFTIIDPNGRAI